MYLIKTFLITILYFVICNNAFSANIPDNILNMPIKLMTGETITIKQYQGKKPVYIKFWASWCQPCLKQMHHFEQIQQKYGEQLKVIGINLAINDNLEMVNKIKQKYKLTMSTAMDNHSVLANALYLKGTPYHLLFDKNSNLVHITHKADEVLDNKIALINQEQPIKMLAKEALNQPTDSNGFKTQKNKTYALFFSATWCDWYFMDSRPEMSQQCIKAQNYIANASDSYKKINWQGIISRLWTGAEELTQFKKKYQIQYPINIDSQNQLFHQFKITTLPTLVIVKNDKVIFRTSSFDQPLAINKQLIKL